MGRCGTTPGSALSPSGSVDRISTLALASALPGAAGMALFLSLSLTLGLVVVGALGGFGAVVLVSTVPAPARAARGYMCSGGGESGG